MQETERNTHDGEKSQAKTLGRLTTLLVASGIALAAVFLIYIINSSEPKAERETAVRQTAMLVDVVAAERGTYRPQITGFGTVTAARDIELSPRVSGRVVSISDNFIPGGFVAAGETLLKLDPSDYELALKQQESALKQTESTLALERGRQDVAERDFEVLGKGFKDKNLALALREPQLASAEAVLLSAQALLDQARLDLARTELKAPFNAQILSRSANTGSEVSPGNTVARLVGVDEYHVIVTVPLTRLQHIAFPVGQEVGAPVQIYSRSIWPKGVFREGTIRSLIGAIDMETRLARILVSVKDPISLSEHKGSPALIVGSIVQAHISGITLENIVRLDRENLRKDDTVWVMQDDTLQIRSVDVTYRDTDYVYIREGLEVGDKVVTTQLATVLEGAPLRMMGGLE